MGKLRDFEKDLADMMGGLMKENADVCVEVWSALANVSWYHPETGSGYSTSFRAAGGLIAEILGKGDYMDWYCSGAYAVASDRIARRMKKRGWIADTMPEICDEPNCFEFVGCGWHDGTKYRHTCGQHIGEHKPPEQPKPTNSKEGRDG